MELTLLMKQKYIEREIKKEIQLGNLRKGSSKLTKVKEELRNKYEIVYLNIITDKNSKYTLNIRDKEHSYIYDYNFDNGKLTLIGGIRNVNIK